MNAFENIQPLIPVGFFAFQIDCFYSETLENLEKKHKLPDLSQFHNRGSFAQILIGWNTKGIIFHIIIEGVFETSDFPNFRLADSVELFFDTRDVKTAGYPTRFCHHFFFLPVQLLIDDKPLQAGEITRFRTEDAHPLCDSSLLSVKEWKQGKNTHLYISIPADCLHGYDPIQFDRLGFTYRINRIDGKTQAFAPSDINFPIEAHPALWSTLKLIKGP